MAAAGPGGSADKASKVKSLLASYYDLDDAEGEPSPSLYDTPRWVGAGGCNLHSRSKTVMHVVPYCTVMQDVLVCNSPPAPPFAARRRRRV